jgi:hypothetical protein
MDPTALKVVVKGEEVSESHACDCNMHVSVAAEYSRRHPSRHMMPVGTRI